MSNSHVHISSIIAKNISAAVRSGRPIKLISYSLTEDTEQKLDLVIEKILENFDRPDLKSVIYTCVKELAINGTKANIKHIFFNENGLNINHEEDYKNGTADFKKNFSEKWLYSYGDKAKKMGIAVRIEFFYDKSGIKVEIINNSPISQIDDKRLRGKLGKVAKYEDISQYYMEHADDTEGAGMGIALIVMLLKGIKLHPKNFTIGSRNGATTSRLLFPFNTL